MKEVQSVKLDHQVYQDNLVCLAQMVEMALMERMAYKDPRDHKVQLDQLDHQVPLVSRDHKEIEVEMVILEKLVHQERKDRKENLAHKEMLDYMVLRVKEGNEGYQDLLG